MKMKSGFSPDSSKTSLSNSMFLDCKIVMDKDYGCREGSSYGFKEVPF
jgi:hypothetical protein